MGQTAWTLILALGLVLVWSNTIEAKTVVKRQASQNEIDPIVETVVVEEQDREKRSQSHNIDPKWGVKNAVLGFVFNKINSFIDQKTHWISQLDKTNIAKNKAHGIYPPADPVASLSGILSGKIGKVLQASAPLVTVVTNKLSGGSNPSGGSHAGFGIGSLLGGFSGGSGLGASAGVQAHSAPGAGVGVYASAPGAHVGASVGAYGTY